MPPRRPARRAAARARGPVLAVAVLTLAACSATSAASGPVQAPRPTVTTPTAPPELTRLSGSKAPDALDVMTFNIRDAQIAGGTPASYARSGRREAVAQVLVDERPDLVGTQEMPDWQAEALREDLAAAGLTYTWYGRGRVSDRGGRPEDFNETVAVFHDPAVLEDLDRGDVWFCDERVEPFQGCVDAGPGWRAGDPRMATWVRFRHRATGAEFYAVNTHLDAYSGQARTHGAQVVARLVAGFEPPLPVVLTGDFNGGTDAEPHTVLTDAGFVDTWTAAGVTGPEWSTFHRGVAEPAAGPRIDRVYTRPGLDVAAAAVVTPRATGGVLASDHFPVVARVLLLP